MYALTPPHFQLILELLNQTKKPQTMRFFSLLIPILIAPLLIQAQAGPWTLERCINYAKEHNITVQQSQLNVQRNELQLKQSQFAKYPNLNASAGYNLNFGRSVDPTTYQFTTQNIQSSQIGLNSNVTLFQGFQLNNTVKQNEQELAASKYALQATEMDVSLMVTQAYLNALLAKEALASAQGQLRTVKEQEESMRKRVEAGALPEGDLMEVEAQVAQQEYQVVSRENDVQLTLLNLQLTMLLEPNPQFDISIPVANVDGLDLATYGSVDAVFNQSLETHPTMKDAELQQASAATEVDIAKGNALPVLTLSGNLGTNQSNARALYDQQLLGYDTIGVVGGTGAPVIATFPSYTLVEQPYPYFTQIGDNFYESVGLNLSIPIFNRWQVRHAVEQAKVNRKAADLQYEQRRNTLRNDIYTAYTNASAASKQYAAAQNNYRATEKAFEYTQKRAEQGMATPFDFNIAQNNLTIAETSMLQAKYQYLLSLKVLDFYLGNPITLD